MKESFVVFILTVFVSFIAGFFTEKFIRDSEVVSRDSVTTVQHFERPEIASTGIAEMVDRDLGEVVPEAEDLDTVKAIEQANPTDTTRVSSEIKPLKPITFLIVKNWPSGGWDSVWVDQLGRYDWRHKEEDSTATKTTVIVTVVKKDLLGEVSKYALLLGAAYVVYAEVKKEVVDR